MMGSYNLTESQKDVLRWMVQEVQNGNLSDSIMLGFSKSGTSIADYRGEHPEITQGVLAIFERNGLLVCQRSRYSYTCTLKDKAFKAVKSNFGEREMSGSIYESVIPGVIQESLHRFKAEHPDPNKVAFIMMQFGKTRSHEQIVEGIRLALKPLGITALRADDKQYHDDLFPNVLTYIYGCGMGIAVFERIEADEFNPNVSLEVGYMFALKKSVCLLKDRTIKTLTTDLIGKLYKTFDPQDPVGTIPNELQKWLEDKGLSSS